MSSPVPIFGTQDLHDDDAAVIDSYFVESDAPPNMDAAKQPIDKTPDTGIVATTTLKTQEQIFNPTWDPRIIMPSDNDRVHLVVRVISLATVPSTTDGVRLGSDMNNVNLSGRLLCGQTIQLDDHTGALIAKPENYVGAVNSDRVAVEVWSVTK